MSGGFFRGTSADQDTRFSNKQAKLLKSQKFAPELDHLVHMTKVNMDVIRPWIATRATELLGFEDEVLINFVYGLLDGKEVDGKQIQVQLTGFMEKNTGKFMKELWSLLLSAQNNVSGVPQRFLDAKEEETKKKKAETDRIAQEIQKRRDRDGRELERERKSRFDGEADSQFTTAASDSVSKFPKPRASSVHPEEDRETDGRHGSRTKNGLSKSPPPKDCLPSPSQTVNSPTRSKSKSISRSRSHSDDQDPLFTRERHKSRSFSLSSQSPRHSVSPRRRYQSPERRSLCPKRRYGSPPRLSASPHHRRSISHLRHSPWATRSPSRRRSPPLRRSSRSRHRSPSPFRYRSPLSRRRSPRRRSPSPRRRSPSPHWRRSPLRRRSPSLSSRRRSPSPPSLCRSPSPPSRRRSPLKPRRRSPLPVRQRSPVRHKSLSPARGWSRSPLRRRSPLPKSPKHRRRSPLCSLKSRPACPSISTPQRKRSHSPNRSQSPSHRTRRSLSREHDTHANGNESGRHRDEQTSRRTVVKKSPPNYSLERDLTEPKHKVPENTARKVPISLRSPQRDIDNRSGDRKKMLVVSRENSLSNSESPTEMRKVNPRTSRSLSRSPVRQTSNRISSHDSPITSKEEKSMSRTRAISRGKIDSSCKRSKDSTRDVSPESYSPDRRESSQLPAAHGRPLHWELKKKDSRQGSDVCLPERNVQQLPNSSEELECAPGRAREERSPRGHSLDGQQFAKLLKRDVSLDRMEQAGDDERKHQQGGDEYDELHLRTESNTKSKKKMGKKSRLVARDSNSEDTSSYRNENMEKRRHKKSDKHKRDYDETSESDSVDEKKEAKRRKKDEKRLRKEERRRRREERHRKKLERQAGKMKVKSIDTVSPPDFEMDQGDGGDSDDCGGMRKNSHPSDVDETESEQKKLEIELREKALKSLRAKKAISH